MYWLPIISNYVLGMFSKGLIRTCNINSMKKWFLFWKVFRGRSTQFLCPMIVHYLSKIDPNTEIILKSRVEKLLCGQKWTCAKKWQNSTNYNHSSSHHHNALWAKSFVKVARSSFFSHDFWNSTSKNLNQKKACT